MTDADDLEFVLIVGNDGDAANGYRALQRSEADLKRLVADQVKEKTDARL
jgi:hypothetical protein